MRLGYVGFPFALGCLGSILNLLFTLFGREFGYLENFICFVRSCIKRLICLIELLLRRFSRLAIEIGKTKSIRLGDFETPIFALTLM